MMLGRTILKLGGFGLRIMPQRGLVMATNNAPFVGPLDELQSQGAQFLYVGSTNRLLTSYTGNAMRLQGNGTGSPEAEIPFLANGQIDLAAAAAIAAQDGGTAAFGVNWYNQSGIFEATQPTAASRMKFSTALNAKGGWGDGSAAQTNFSLNLSDVTFPFYVSAVVKTVNNTSSRVLLGTSASTSNRFMRVTNSAMQQNWGTSLNGTAFEVSDDLHVLGFLANGASSKHFLDESLLLTGNAGTSQNLMTSGRLGGSGFSSWLNTGGNAIFEMVIFDGDPTGLAGFNAFQANQLERFS
jgi:hypothetical protein